ncbi:hypothetical protein, conserved [Trypanosoma brucei gambiense DAL972]|uniref:Uncharacterized protein n=1 Tax=Trypanosoma brucei gambiense (strain MHOM/CI/86/DAL972) TaxID=679716 RepID=D0A9C8_TRYB9|nr:hypothetical protein, conserved [Trypanosoma brucei gambiense DAL972]CBH18279.1 hypothetical protein, conserved [Trypanosoma brucei gambiense DAL972]|eukprot:XP_011780543.1 hypothetical protein, conserved [Trypanosoma brucei gambiense DAL972]
MTSVKETKEPKPSINRARDLPWWKRLVLDPSYRKRVRRIATECYRKEMSVVRDFPEKLFSAEREYGVPLVSSSQYVQLEGESKWATRHPSTIMKTSSLKTLRDSATTTVLPVFGQDHESRVDDEIKRLFQQEKADNRLYGLSYIWDEQLPPMGFIRQWPPPHQGMWPTGCVHRQLQKVQLPSDRKAREALAHNPLFVHIYRQGGEFLGVWRQSLLLLRYKIICCALHEEALGSRNPNGEKKSSTRRAHLMYVPEFTSPLLRLQGDTTVSVMEGRVNVETISPPTTWEGLAPSPSKVHVDQGYLNWCAFHNSSPMVRQSVRDVYNMLPHDEDGRLTKDVFVEFVLDLLNLFFPLNNSASNIAIAEEEWAFRGTSELVSFDTFFEKFFSFPFIFLRNFEEVTRDMYVEVWCLIRICLLETEHTIHSSSRGITTNVTEVLKQRLEQDYEQTATRTLHRIPKQRSFTLNGGNSNANLDFQMVPKPKMAPLHSKGRPPPQQPRDIPALISGINGFTAEDVINLGCTDFHNTDNYKTYAMKRRILEECEDAPYKIPSSRQVLFAHKKAERLLAEDREANQLESPQIFLEVEEANDSLGTYVLGSPSSSTTGSVKSHNNRMESMKKRRDALEELENRHTIEKLLATSYWYRRRRQQRKKALNDAHTLVSRCHTSWEMFQYDVYEIPEENPTEVDDLIAFVLDLPDDFFVVDTSLRMRNTVYRVHESVRESRLPKVRKVDELQLFEERIKKEAESLWRERLYGTEKQSVKEGDSEAAQPEGSSTTVDDEVPPRLPAKSKRGFTSPKCGASPSSPRQRPGETGRLRPLLSALSKSPPRLDTTALVESPCRNGGCETPKPDRVTARRRREELEEEERILQKKEERVLGMRLRLKERMDAEYMRRVKLKSQRRSIPLVIRAAQRKNVD